MSVSVVLDIGVHVYVVFVDNGEGVPNVPHVYVVPAGVSEYMKPAVAAASTVEYALE
jgi:hypothetical protein